MMKSLKSLFFGFALLCIAVHAQAAVTSVDNLFTNPEFLSNAGKFEGTLSGSFDFTYIGAEAGHTNILLNSIDEVIFTNKAYDNTPATSSGATKDNLDIAKLFLVDTSYDINGEYGITKWSAAVNIYLLKNAFTIASLTFAPGTYFFGFNDTVTSGNDFDNLVFAASPVPLPGAALFLGSGLLGLVGLRRRQIV